MRILFFTENLRAGGKERQIIELLKGLIKSHEVVINVVLTKNEIHYTEIADLKIPIHVIERKFIKKDPRLFFLFFRIAKKFKPDIIHVFGHMPAFYAIPTKVLLGIPMLNNEIQDTNAHSEILFKNFVFRMSDKIIGNSYSGIKAYNSPINKSAVIYNGFSFDRLNNLTDPKIVRAKFGITTGLVVGMVASFNEYKDYGTYIRSALLVLDVFQDITFLCIGDGDDSSYKKLIPEEKSKKILFLGKQSNVESIMNICHIGILSTHGEGISNALIEFMALGKPVITTDYFGGSNELIEQNISGFIIKPQDPSELANKIELLINNDNLRDEVGKNAKERVAIKFNNEVMVNSFYQVYSDLKARF
jgi:glycosyltransferase involved in cell wall biosynthesis